MRSATDLFITSIRDCLVHYYLVLRLRRESASKRPADSLPIDAVARDMAELWRGLDSRWDSPTVADLRTFLDRIERAFASTRRSTTEIRSLIDAALIVADVGRRIEASQARRAHHRFRVLRGGARETEPSLAPLSVVPASRNADSKT